MLGLNVEMQSQVLDYHFSPLNRHSEEKNGKYMPQLINSFIYFLPFQIHFPIVVQFLVKEEMWCEAGEFIHPNFCGVLPTHKSYVLAGILTKPHICLLETCKEFRTKQIKSCRV